MIWTKIKIFYRFYGKIQNDFRRENPKKIREFEKDISNWKKININRWEKRNEDRQTYLNSRRLQNWSGTLKIGLSFPDFKSGKYLDRSSNLSKFKLVFDVKIREIDWSEFDNSKFMSIDQKWFGDFLQRKCQVSYFFFKHTSTNPAFVKVCLHSA